jgi:uncharacterized Zn-binding protein involved in type VI secretion
MPDQARVGDIGKVDSDAHGCPACPHCCQGPIILGSPTVFVNGMPAARKTDLGIHMACCGPNMFMCDACSGTVNINSLGAHRKDDAQLHCGGQGKETNGSPNVITGG